MTLITCEQNNPTDDPKVLNTALGRKSSINNITTLNSKQQQLAKLMMHSKLLETILTNNAIVLEFLQISSSSKTLAVQA